MVFNNLFCVLFKKKKMKWNEKWIKKRKWNELKKKNKRTKIYKAFEWYWVVGHLVVGRFKSKKNDKWKRKEKRERRRESGVIEALGCKGEQQRHPPLDDRFDGQTSLFSHVILRKVLLDTMNISTAADFIFNGQIVRFVVGKLNPKTFI